MKILIVDDDAYIIRNIKSQINWEAIGIDNVYTALNAQKAKEILTDNEIDIMITDIEMPLESGLDLMRWTIDKGYNPVSICLTCHERFDYAREALNLGYIEYCVKPVEFKELERKIENAVNKCISNNKNAKLVEQGAFWEKNKKIVASDFWRNLLQGSYRRSVQDTMKYAAQKKIDYQFETKYQCSLISFCSFNEEESEWENDKSLMKYALYNIISEKFPDEDRHGMIGWSGKKIWIVIDTKNIPSMIEEIQDYLDVCRDLLGINLAAYVSNKVFGEDLKTEFERLNQLDIDNVRRSSGVFTSNNKDNLIVQESINDNILKECKRLLEGDRYSEFFDVITEYIIKNKTWNSELLESFILNFITLISSKVIDLDISVDEIFDREIIQGLMSPSKSIDQIVSYVEIIKKNIYILINQQDNESKIINDVKKYIRANIETKLYRRDIANSVHLSPDYLTKIFRKKTGMTLIEYITEERVNDAKIMIINENIPIGEVAHKVGYDNFSYFSEVFRKKTGVTPSEYKNVIFTKKTE